MNPSVIAAQGGGDSPGWPSSLERYASIVQNAVEGIFQSTPDGRYLLVNPALANMYGYSSPQELMTQVQDISRTIYVDPAVRDEFKRLMALEGEVRGLEYQVRRKDGEIIWVSESSRAVRDAEGEVLYYEGFVENITRRKRAEDELRAAKEAAELASKAKSQFLAVMSHEIRTPMNGVIGMASLLLDSPLTAEQRDFAEIIRQSGDSLLTVINDILDFSKIESGRIDLENEEFILRDCIEGALDLLAPRAAEKKLDLLYEIAGDVPVMVSGDCTRLRQILVNLLGNAVKFTEQGEVVLSIKSEPVASAGDTRVRLLFKVRDSGIGIPQEAMGRLFKSFSQVDASTTRRYGGTGLGLVISKRLAGLMGGDMLVESEVGKGSVFRFSVVAEAVPNMPAPCYADPRTMLAGRRLLIVDDNATNRRILTTLARTHGMNASSLDSGPAALDLLSSGETFDFAILDMQMPDMDGVMLAKEIRRLRLPNVFPLVLLSSLGLRDMITDPEMFAACLTKPTKPAQIVEVLMKLVHRERLAATSSFAAGASALAKPLRPERVLLVEDNRVNQKVALRMLERLGFRADLAVNGVEALKAVEQQSYDIILMDMQMPEMDGLEATRRMRAAIPAGVSRPTIIALTASAMAEDRERCMAAGMDDYLNKPIELDDLAAVIKRALDARAIAA